MLKKPHQLLVLFLLSFSFLGRSQASWQLAKQQDGIKIFLKAAEGSDIKMLHAECDIAARPEAVLALLLDVQATDKWIPQTKNIRFLRRQSATEATYYQQLALPWPVSDRDYIVHIKAWQQPATKVYTLDANLVEGEVPEVKNLVRVHTSIVKWVMHPAPNNHTKLVYEIYTDPGGSIPTSLVNYFAKQAAIDIVKKMRQMVLQPPYRDAASPFK